MKLQGTDFLGYFCRLYHDLWSTASGSNETKHHVRQLTFAVEGSPASNELQGGLGLPQWKLRSQGNPAWLGACLREGSACYNGNMDEAKKVIRQTKSCYY